MVDIKAEELDKRFDEGEDIAAHLDHSRARRVHCRLRPLDGRHIVAGHPGDSTDSLRASKLAYGLSADPRPVRRAVEIAEEDATMPVLSRFLGIVIAMYWDDHSPPHFHAKYGGYEITVEILTGVVEGRFPKRALRHVLEWSELHKDELIADWELCQRNEAPKPIEPLE